MQNGIIDEVRAYVVTQIEERLSQAGQQTLGTAQTLRSVAETLHRDAATRGIGDAASRGAGYLEQIGGYLDKSEIDGLVADVEAFGRRRPWSVAVIGLGAGLVASRFLKASAGRRNDDSPS